MDLPVIQLVPSKGYDTVGDCGICALATISNRTYEDVVAIATMFVGENWKNGLYITQIIDIAKELGVNLKRRRKYDLDDSTGILNCTITERPPNRKAKTTNHVVVVMDGKIYDSDLRVWSPDAYKHHYTADFRTLLEIT